MQVALSHEKSSIIYPYPCEACRLHRTSYLTSPNAPTCSAPMQIPNRQSRMGNFPGGKGPSYGVVSVGEFYGSRWDGELGQFHHGGLHMGFPEPW